MVGKPFVIGVCLLFWTWPCITFNSIPIILKLLTNRNIALIYSVIICEQKTKDCARSGSFQHKLQHHKCFQLWCLPGFLTSVLYWLWFQWDIYIFFVRATYFFIFYSCIQFYKFHWRSVIFMRLEEKLQALQYSVQISRNLNASFQLPY